jgi:hypothetical protein
VKKLKEREKNNADGDGLNITTGGRCSLGLRDREEKRRTKQSKGGDWAWHSPAGVAEATTGEENPCEENKRERVYSWQKSAFTDWGFAVRCVWVPLF